MPIGPKGERRPADAIGLAVMIGKIATGEIEHAVETKNAAALSNLGWQSRARNLTAACRSEIARTVAALYSKK